MYMAGLGKRRRSERLISLALALLVVAGGITGAWLHWHHTAAQTTANTSPVPKNVAQAVNFPIYYPDPQKLPAGYNLNSFKYVPGQGVLYYVSYDNGKRLVFTLQQKPSSQDLAAFNKKYIPIHRQVLTLVGTATIGAIGSQTVVSLPTDKTWVIITGPSDIYGTDQLTQVLQSIKKSS
jgi:hypothetical protein